MIFCALSAAIDESTDITYIAQHAILIRGVNASLTATEEFVHLAPMTGMTNGDGIFGPLVGALDNVAVDWAHAVSVAPEMVHLQ